MPARAILLSMTWVMVSFVTLSPIIVIGVGYLAQTCSVVASEGNLTLMVTHATCAPMQNIKTFATNPATVGKVRPVDQNTKKAKET